MKHAELINQFREGLASISREVEISTSMSHFDINLICENLFCGVLKELYDLPGLRNLNDDERKNYPGIDLADDDARIAIQVTSDKSLEKIKDTIKKIITYKLYEKYDEFFVYCLTSKQNSYSQESIDKECQGMFVFNVQDHVLDYRDLGSKAANANPQKLKNTVDIMGAYQRGCDVGLAEEDFDPPEQPEETLSTNLIEFYMPSRLYVAEVRAEVLKGKSGKKARNQRKKVADYARSENRPLPSGFDVSASTLITFHNLEESDNPYSHVIEEGTAEYLDPSNYYSIDEDHECIFKSLLRFNLQEKLYKRRVMWQFEEKLFIFLPYGNKDVRSEGWIGQKKSTRRVFERKYNRDNPDKVFQVKHFAFSTNFLLINEKWYVSITPDWFFSWGDDFRRSSFGDKPLSGLKRMEKNRSIFDQFRFLAAWLKNIDEEDLFSDEPEISPSITFGDILELKGGRYLNESLWEPLKASEAEDIDQWSLIENDY
ncbi:MAG: SMEK domain-containing protein [Candidatus Thiodiazotropha sp.]